MGQKHLKLATISINLSKTATFIYNRRIDHHNRLLKIRLSSSSSDQVVKSLIFCFVHLVRSPVLLVDRPDEGGQLPDRVASSGVSEPHPVHPRPKLGGGSSSWGERDVTASRVRFAPGVAFSPLHYIS